MKKNNLFLIGITGIVTIIISAFIFLNTNENSQPIDFIKQIVEIYHSPTCGCCENYEEYLKTNGFEVKSIELVDLENIKDDFGIPRNARSCHTVKIGKYFVEGHVPIEAIKKLLDEQPEIDGIALPGMPPGSPGMPGIKTQPFVIYSISNGNINEFMRT